jgi:hypothetical protein
MNEGWVILMNIPSVRIDGKAAQLTPERPDNWMFASWDIDDDRVATGSVPVGTHRLQLDLRLDIHHGNSVYPERGPLIHTETRIFETSFLVEPLPDEQSIKLDDLPQMAGAIQKSIVVTQLDYWPGGMHINFRSVPAPVSFAFDIYLCFAGQEQRIGQISQSAKLTSKEVWIQLDDKAPIYRQHPDKVDIVFRSSAKAAATTLDIYDIWKGEIVLKDVPIKQQ